MIDILSQQNKKQTENLLSNVLQ